MHLLRCAWICEAVGIRAYFSKGVLGKHVLYFVIISMLIFSLSLFLPVSNERNIATHLLYFGAALGKLLWLCFAFFCSVD